MNKTKDNLTTPKQRKKLGLKRNSVLKDSAEKTKGSTTTTKSVLASETKSTTRLPQSDARVNYRNSESKVGPEVNTPGTPKSSSELQRLAVSTNCRPYRLSLSKRVRENMTKKRLKFHLANEIEKDEEEIDNKVEVTNKTEKVIASNDYSNKTKEDNINQQNSENKSKIMENMTSQELMAQIETLQTDLTIRQEHVKKVQELQEAIVIWKNGFSSALSDLQQKIETRLDTKTLLDRLKIPQEMIKYVND